MKKLKLYSLKSALLLTASLLAGSLAYGADRSDLFVPDASKPNGYYQEMHKDSRKFPLKPISNESLAALNKLATNPDYIDELVMDVYPATSKSSSFYKISENQNMIKSYLMELDGRLPTLEESNKWGGMLDSQGKVVGWKLYANAVIAFQNMEIMKDRIRKDIQEGSNRTVERLKYILENSIVCDKPENIPSASSGQSAASSIPEVIAMNGDIVKLAMSANAQGYRNIVALVASDPVNVNGSPFEGPQNTVDESISYCAPELTLVHILAALGYAYPNPATIMLPAIEMTRKAKDKVDPKNRFESTVYEELATPFNLSIINAPGYDLRIPLKNKGIFQKAEDEINNKKEAEIKESEGYKTTPVEGQAEYLKAEMNNFKNDKSDRGFFKLFDKVKLTMRDEWLSDPANREEYLSSLKPRIELIIKAAEYKGADCLIIPAWATGVFLNKVEDIYQAINAQISEGSSIKTIILSTFLPEHETAYKAIFQGKGNNP